MTQTIKQLLSHYRPNQNLQKYSDNKLYIQGNTQFLNNKVISIIGSRQADIKAQKRAHRLGRELASHNVTVMSGLAKGIDTIAMQSAFQNNGQVAGILGTSLDKVYPKENENFQRQLGEKGLLISPFAPNSKTEKWHFPFRDKVLAQISDALVVVTAKDRSGTLHAVREALRLNKPVYVMKSLTQDNSITWYNAIKDNPNVHILTNTQQLINKQENIKSKLTSMDKIVEQHGKDNLFSNPQKDQQKQSSFHQTR